MGSTQRDDGASRSVRHEDRRVRRSRRAIMDAFDRLIIARPLEEITVSAIAREADVDRKTFYHHFGTIDGMLDSMAEEIVCDLLDGVDRATREGRAETPRDSALTDGAASRALAERTLTDFFEALAERLGKNVVLGRRYCEHVPTDLLFDHLSRPLAKQVSARGLMVDGMSAEELDMVLSFILGGLFSLFRWWLLSDQAVPIEEVIFRANQLVRNGVSPLM